MNNNRKLLLAAMLVFSGLQMGCATLTPEQLNARDGRFIVIADVTETPKPGAIDRAAPARSRGDSYSDGGQLAGAAVSGGAGVGGSLLGGILFGAAMTPTSTSYDSRFHAYKVIKEKDCKRTTGISRTDEADISGLVPGGFGHWQTGYKSSVWLSTLTGQNGKPIPKIDASHPCFAAYEAAVREHAAEKQAAQTKNQSAAK